LIRLLSISLCAGLLASPSEALAEKRFALVVGVNRGKAKQQQELRYAESDARRVAEILRTVGRFHPANVLLLTEPSAAQVREAIAELEQRIRAEKEGSLLFVFYSGHADGAALNLGDTPFPLDEVREQVLGSSASARILVIDACRSGVLTRVKGGWPGPAFEVPDDRPIGAEGIAILASSAAGEEAQESDELGASFFTHYFASALLGAADKNGDREVTLGETFSYAAERTLAATNTTFVGPQHPTYRVELKGRDDLVLTSLSASPAEVGILAFREPGAYLIQEAEGERRTIAEVALLTGQVRHLAVSSGRYQVTRRASDHLLQGEFEVRPANTTEVRDESMGQIAYARMVRKGDGGVGSALSALAVGGVRSPLLEDIGVAWRVGAGARYDLPEITFELRVELGGASKQNERTRTSTREVMVALAAMRAFDVGPVTLAVGLEVGGVWFSQHFTDVQAEVRNQFAGLFAPVGLIELPIQRFYARLEVGLPIYVLRVGNDPQSSAIEAHVAYRGGLGFGFYF
jgi:hypothetical protein